ncbi:coiled-coil domain-containing protein 63-like [Symsagittifera roscoffensis]|uniref:coiled-coil domain-containing protein 63-like n=1 Tax=Symsagittifera roscoffensis TaxID=84072 RepID=UPI00307B1EA2
MPHPRSAGKSDADDQNDQMLEAELNKLINHHRVIDKDRTAYQHDAMERIRVQEREIKLLEAEREEHLKNLKLAESDQNQSRDQKKSEELRQLVEERDETEDEIKQQADEEKQLDAELKRAEKELREKLKASGGASGSSEGARQRTSKQIRTLENKLDNTLKKFSSQLADNQRLRKEVDSARYEKNRFEEVYRKLEQHNEAIRVEMGRIIDQSNQAYDQREEAQNKIISGKEKADKEEATHQSEMRELQRSIDHEKKLRQFMDIKKSEREEDEFTKQHKRKKEEEMREKKAKEGQKDTAEIYEKAIREIERITAASSTHRHEGDDQLEGESKESESERLELIVSRFIENEERNFALFQFINDQNNTIENRKDELDKKERDMSSLTKREEQLDRERQAKLREIEEKQTVVSEHCKHAQQKLTLNDKVLDQLKKAIQSVFDKIECPRESIEDLLGANQGIKENNMMQYLGIVEERTNELLRIKSYIDFKEQDKTDGEGVTILGLLGEGPKPPLQKQEIIAPSTGDGYGSDEGSDEEVKPLSVAELRQRAMRNVAKKERMNNQMNSMNNNAQYEQTHKQEQSRHRKPSAQRKK